MLPLCRCETSILSDLLIGLGAGLISGFISGYISSWMVSTQRAKNNKKNRRESFRDLAINYLTQIESNIRLIHALIPDHAQTVLPDKMLIMSSHRDNVLRKIAWLFDLDILNEAETNEINELLQFPDFISLSGEVTGYTDENSKVLKGKYQSFAKEIRNIHDVFINEKSAEFDKKKSNK